MAEKKKFVVKIDRRLCKGCNLCIEFCPKNVLGLSSDLSERGVAVAEVRDADACIGCRNCTIVCPDAAVELYIVEKEPDEPASPDERK
jgi:2-oxoglutarate ferredoxin oxidoreductase subunit delta